ncbi:uncharacterized protein EI90DRAFT_3292698 [Cantharellus anzutake]|uniref:uncharacterized protein n=1 Tax=Cantharellus anzutake TaxID=1750568 RepID=UPI00190659CC|nr:uncharacterized protein EI90DRAFT_3292698 [Cantharellus anzutake]KAF8321426.1 hypothetical protein EI90DRAFT_3292698 [Cantharellus anzutake]
MSSAWTSFSPTPQELAYAQLLFNKVDPSKLGIITGDAAISLFAGSNLPPEKLGEVWAIADHDNNGFLSKKGAAVAVRLIGWAQYGEDVSESLLLKSGPLPTIAGIQYPEPSRSASPRARPQSPVRTSALGPITPEDRSKYLRLFANCNPTNGLLSGDKARDVFLKSRLPVEKLGQIWGLADSQKRGALDAADFAVGMHLIQAAMANPAFVIPGSLPPAIFEQAGKTPAPVAAHSTGGSIASPTLLSFPSSPSSQPLKPQYTGPMLKPQASLRAGTASSPAFTTPSNSAAPVWDITEAEKSKSDGFFSSLDPQGRGYIEGDVAVPFMLESRLSEQVLAQIWDLGDLNNDGKLTREGFAVAMHLISNQLAGKPVPDVLPPTLVPPSLRGKDSTGTPAPAPPTLQGRSNTRDLLSDDEDAGTKDALPPSSSVIGNTKNQLDSTTASLNKAKAEREQLERTVTESAAQLAQLESQLASAKAAHEIETKVVDDLRARKAEQTENIRKTREELITAESDVSALKAERAEIEGSILRDKEEIRALQKMLKESEHERLLTELAAEKEDLMKINDEIAETDDAIQALSIAPELSQPDVAARATSPIVWQAQPLQKSNNPFGRFASSVSTPPAPVFHPFGVQDEVIGELVLGRKATDPFGAAYGLSDTTDASHEDPTPLKDTEDSKPDICTNGTASPAEHSATSHHGHGDLPPLKEVEPTEEDSSDDDDDIPLGMLNAMNRPSQDASLSQSIEPSTNEVNAGATTEIVSPPSPVLGSRLLTMHLVLRPQLRQACFRLLHPQNLAQSVRSAALQKTQRVHVRWQAVIRGIAVHKGVQAPLMEPSKSTSSNIPNNLDAFGGSTNGHVVKSDVTGTSFHTPLSSPHTDVTGSTWPSVPPHNNEGPTPFDAAFNVSPSPSDNHAQGTRRGGIIPGQKSIAVIHFAHITALGETGYAQTADRGRKKSDATEAPSRSSKLLRFGFGKNKDKKSKKVVPVEGPPPAPSLPPRPRRTGSLSVPDVIGSVGPDGDIQPVQTLMDMGFSRERAVDALERHNYDVNTALNSLVK